MLRSSIQSNIFVSDSDTICMARFCIKLLIVVALLQLTTSCVDLVDFKSNEKFVVTTNDLYVRDAPTPTSLVLETYKLGDTIVAKPTEDQWFMVELTNNKVGFISATSIKPIDTEQAEVFSLVDRLIDWHTWYFWVVAVVLIVLWIFVEKASVDLKTYLKVKQGVSIKGLLLTPVVLFVFGIMSGVLYVNWYEDFISGLQSTFLYLPTNIDAISWVLWVQMLIILVALLFDLLGAIFMSGVKWGPILTLVDLLLGISIFSTAFFLTISLYIVGIVLLIVFFASHYTSMVSKNNRRVKLYQRPK